MIDRFGRSIYVGWAAHEIIWLQSAMTLPHGERQNAYRDIASMSGRSFIAVKAQAASMRLNDRRLLAKADAEILRNRTVLVPAKTTKGPAPFCEIRQPTKAQLMAGR